MEKSMKDEISGNKENLVGTVKFDKSENVAESVGNVEALDTDGDGIVDTINRDLDGDGITDMSTKMTDVDGDGITDTIATDYDGDGIADTTTNMLDTDGDGITDTITRDIDGDGITDTTTNMLDTDGDGITDTITRDIDGDGITDTTTTMLDTDGDGITDTITRDLDGDGITDTTTNMLDTDGDGITDTITRDLDGDGITDSMTQYSDIDGDGITDTIATDTNMDGFADQSMVLEDVNADGIADQASFYSAGDTAGYTGGAEGLTEGGMGMEGLDAGGMEGLDAGGMEGLEGAEAFDVSDLLDACFSEDMRVLTSNGYVPIKDVKKGMEIVSYDENRKTFYNRAVNTIQTARKRQLWKLVLTDSTKLKVTGNHRLLTENGWNKVSQIKTGDLVLSIDGLVAVKKVEKTDIVGTVFNLHTRMEKNYIVEGIIAHNFTHLFKLRTLLSKYLVDIFVTEKTSPRNLLPSSDKL
jgi:hypothetical protein